MDDLLIPATAELLDDWFGPVVYLDCAYPWVIRHVRDGAYVVQGTGDGTRGSGGGGYDSGADLDDLRLDLSRAECRDRVARVLAQNINKAPMSAGIRQGATAPDAAFRFPKSGGSFTLAGAQEGNGGGGPSMTWLACVGSCDGLVGLDPLDDARLPDGSRRVDALALAAVWRSLHPVTT